MVNFVFVAQINTSHFSLAERKKLISGTKGKQKKRFNQVSIREKFAKHSVSFILVVSSVTGIFTLLWFSVFIRPFPSGGVIQK